VYQIIPRLVWIQPNVQL